MCVLQKLLGMQRPFILLGAHSLGECGNKFTLYVFLLDMFVLGLTLCSGVYKRVFFLIGNIKYY